MIDPASAADWLQACLLAAALAALAAGAHRALSQDAADQPVPRSVPTRERVGAGRR